MKSKIIGWLGERKTAIKLWGSLRRKSYHRFHNIILPSKNGTTQIDHLIISRYGLFIVETKSRKGWIFGSKDRSKWTQTLFGQKHTFQNPLYQTFRQKKVLAAFLDIRDDVIFTIVYFNSDCEFKTPLPENVIRSGLGKYIKKFQTTIFTPQDVNRIIYELDEHCLASDLSTRDHINSLNERHGSNTVCPNCGDILVIRTASKGLHSGKQFLGCQAYPKCRFTRNI